MAREERMNRLVIASVCAALLSGCSGAVDYTVIGKAQQLCGVGSVKLLYVNGINGGDIRIDCLNGLSKWSNEIEWQAP
jgi:hypothetical protein